jgi:hypothetical protein
MCEPGMKGFTEIQFLQMMGLVRGMVAMKFSQTN